ncbi:hypothetical protein EUA04_09025 [Mycolicibacterium obuense]|uniref:Uncharacterized protein n=1 Tax=Mycolicibacterium obuense TaxID=1807 RepID=A0A4R5XB09_9MYCO|nr:hypothetical protein EUA04_09025 [Mycolicibacterium obuense]
MTDQRSITTCTSRGGDTRGGVVTKAVAEKQPGAGVCGRAVGDQQAGVSGGATNAVEVIDPCGKVGRRWCEIDGQDGATAGVDRGDDSTGRAAGIGDPTHKEPGAVAADVDVGYRTGRHQRIEADRGGNPVCCGVDHVDRAERRIGTLDGVDEVISLVAGQVDRSGVNASTIAAHDDTGGQFRERYRGRHGVRCGVDDVDHTLHLRPGRGGIDEQVPSGVELAPVGSQRNCGDDLLRGGHIDRNGGRHVIGGGVKGVDETTHDGLAGAVVGRFVGGSVDAVAGGVDG